MTIAKPVIYDGGLQRQLYQGDVLAGAETLGPLTTVGAGTLTAAILSNNTIINRTGPVGAFTDTTDTAATIVATLAGAYAYNQTLSNGLANGYAVQPGLTWRIRYINTVAFAMTLAAGTGVTLVGNTGVNASSVKDYLITVVNGSPQQVFNCATVNGSAVVTGLSQAQTALLSPGMTVTGTGVSGTVISVQSGTGVTLSANASATNTSVSVTFAPVVTVTGLGQSLL